MKRSILIVPIVLVAVIAAWSAYAYSQGGGPVYWIGAASAQSTPEPAPKAGEMNPGCQVGAACECDPLDCPKFQDTNGDGKCDGAGSCGCGKCDGNCDDCAGCNGACDGQCDGNCDDCGGCDGNCDDCGGCGNGCDCDPLDCPKFQDKNGDLKCDAAGDCGAHVQSGCHNKVSHCGDIMKELKGCGHGCGHK